MNLKYYLRGLGLGIMVTALILALAGNRKNSMTDAQIKERAKELGMIENTMLVERAETIEEDIAEKPAQAEEEIEPDEEIKPEEEVNLEEEVKSEAVSKVDDDPETPVQEEEIVEDEIQTVDGEPQTEDSAKEEIEQAGERDDPEANQEEEHEQSQTSSDGNTETESHGQGTLTIVSGDSSYSVAKKLYEMGIVTSVEQTDRFLCSNGYDRTIRTGTYSIGEDETLEQIAKKINGK